MKAESKKLIFDRYSNIGITNVQAQSELYYFNNFIKLKPLSSISDENAKLLGYTDKTHFHDTREVFELLKSESEILQQLGYATPQTVIEDGKVVTYTVDELVNEGVFKLDMNKSIEAGLCNKCEKNKKADTGIYCVECAYEHKMSGY